MDPLPREYWETGYEVELPTGKLVVRIGEAAEGLGSEPWVIVTAWNPGSRALPMEENRRRHAILAERVKEYRTYPATGVADRGDWREEGLLVAGLDEQGGRELGREFGQAAVVVGGSGVLPKIVDCR